MDSPTTTCPLVGSRGCTFIYLWNIIRLSPHLFRATYLYMYVANQSKCVSGILFLKSCSAKSARSCNVTQSHTTLRKVMQRLIRSCNVMQGHAKSRHHAR